MTSVTQSIYIIIIYGNRTVQLFKTALTSCAGVVADGRPHVSCISNNNIAFLGRVDYMGRGEFGD